jgi:hypothetical protein
VSKTNFKDVVVVSALATLLAFSAVLIAFNVHSVAMATVALGTVGTLTGVLHWFYIRDDKEPDA